MATKSVATSENGAVTLPIKNTGEVSSSGLVGTGASTGTADFIKANALILGIGMLIGYIVLTRK